MPFLPFVSVVIASLNGGSVIGQALDSLRKTRYADETTGLARFEVIVVDNGSTDDLAEVVAARRPEVRLIRSPVNLGFAGGNNLGIREAHGDVVVLLNDDAEPRPDWLQAWAAAAAEDPRWGVMGCKLLYPDGETIQHAGGIIEPSAMTRHIGYEEKDDGRFDALIECDYVTGAAIALRRELIDRVGLLDEKYFPIYYEETDYCWQARRIGYQVLYVPGAVVVHHESRTQGRYSFRFIFRQTRCRMRFLCKCFSKWELLRALRHELAWWFKPFSYPCYLPFLCGYVAGLIQLPTHLRDRFPFHRRMEALAAANRPRLEAMEKARNERREAEGERGE